jgi:hypothetical protein
MVRLSWSFWSCVSFAGGEGRGTHHRHEVLESWSVAILCQEIRLFFLLPALALCFLSVFLRIGLFLVALLVSSSPQATLEDATLEIQLSLPMEK